MASRAVKSTTKQQPPAIKSRVMLVTPELAEEWLSRNTHNRPIRQRDVERLADAIKRGEWVMNGDAIRFANDGAKTLLDGQHRLWAIMLADVAVETLVIENLPTEAQDTMDIGVRRSLKDVLSLRGENNALQLAASLTYWWRYSTGQIRYATAKPTIPQALAILDEYGDAIRDAMKIGQRFRGRFPNGVSQSMISAVYFEFSSIDQDDADSFFTKLIEGAGLEEGSPILALRRYLERNATAMAGGGARLTSLVHHALFIKAWNHWRDGQKVGQLNWKAGGMKAEAFPEPH